MKRLTREQKNQLLVNIGGYARSQLIDRVNRRGREDFPPPPVFRAIHEYVDLVARVLDELVLPDAVNVQVMVMPADVIRHGTEFRAITASTRRLRRVTPDQDPVEQICRQLNLEFMVDLERALLEHGEGNFLYFWCPYVLLAEWESNNDCRWFVTRYAKAVTGPNLEVL